MDLINAILLGIIEGITEFLPISSTGHLIIANRFFPLPPSVEVTFDIFIQLGAILAIVWLYRAKILDLLRRLPSDRGAQRFGLALLIAFLPAAILGILIHGAIEKYLFGPVPVAFAMVLGGILILMIDRNDRKGNTHATEEVTTRQSALIGAAQALSLFPGVSRSAATILGGLVTGLDRRTAVEFSFFLAIPTLGSPTLYALAKSASSLQSSDWILLAAGFISTFITALIIVRWFLRYVSTNTLAPFGIYRIVVGFLVLTLYLTGLLRR